MRGVGLGGGSHITGHCSSAKALLRHLEEFRLGGRSIAERLTHTVQQAAFVGSGCGHGSLHRKRGKEVVAHYLAAS